MTQTTINERLKILIESLGMSARAFSSAIGSGDTNTRNYLDRGSKPGADYLEKIVRRFETVNSVWLLTGAGELFLPESAQSATIQTGNFNQTGNTNIQKVKSNKGNVIGTNHGNFTQTIGQHAPTDWERQLESLQRENELLKSQLQDKERTIQILLKQVP